MNDVINNEETTKKDKMLGGVTGKGFMPGQSGNPSGRPKNSLKSYIAKKLADMSDEEKDKWLKDNKIGGEIQWKMGEGNPSNEIEHKGGLTISQVLDDLENGQKTQ